MSKQKRPRDSKPNKKDSKAKKPKNSQQPKKPIVELRAQHPLIRRMVKVRNAHHVKLIDLEACMGIPYQTLGAIERGERPLPDLIAENGRSMRQFFRDWFRCIGCTDQEKRDIIQLIKDTVVTELEKELHDP